MNPGLSPDYFEFHPFSPDSEIPVQVVDAVRTGLRLFRRTMPLTGIYDKLQEQDLLDFDINSFLADPPPCDPLGRYVFEWEGRILILHKVDRKHLEKCLGVDLVYNFADEKRCIFVQYKCQGLNGRKYSFAGDKNLDAQLVRMSRVPEIDLCSNHEREISDLRLCRCPVFIKLCQREIHLHHNVPKAAYYPWCVWKKLMESMPTISIDQRPHITNDNFTECVRSGLIGTTPEQTHQLQDLLDPKMSDERVRLIFEEKRVAGS